MHTRNTFSPGATSADPCDAGFSGAVTLESQVSRVRFPFTGQAPSMSPMRTDDESDQVAGQVGQIVANFWQWHISDFSPVDSWSPSINVYRLPRRIEVCVSLAGVDKRTIEVQVKPGVLTIRGLRQPPEPERPDQQTMCILTMEIDHGPFCRRVALPDQVDLTKVASEYRQGLLWVHIPLRDQS